MPEAAKKRVRPAEKITTANRFSELQGLHPPDPDPPDPPDAAAAPPLAVWEDWLTRPDKYREVRFQSPFEVNHIAKSVEHRLIKLDGTLAGVPARFLLDSGASHSYVSQSFVTRNKLSEASADDGEHSVRLSVTLADGTIKRSGGVLSAVSVRISSYSDHLDLAVTELSSAYDAILGMAWLTHYNPVIDWRAGTISFSKGLEEHVLQPAQSPSPTTKPRSAACLNTISSKQLTKQARKGLIEYAIAVYPNIIHDAIALHSISSSSSTPTASHDPLEEVRQQVLQLFRDVFPDELPAGLPPSREVDHRIELVPGSSPPSRPTFRLSERELVELKKQLEELVKAGFIRPSKSPFGAPILFVKKKDGTMRMCIDYRTAP